MTQERLELGKLGEDLALKKLASLGYTCLVRNYRCPLGEIDCIARDGDCLVFVEIKTRRGRSMGYAKEAVTRRKMRQISKAALSYMKENNCSHVQARFDVIAITINRGREEIEVIPNAFELAY